MADFTSYEKMPEGLHKLGLDLAATKALDKVDWVVTEKIHGANFSFTLDSDTLRYAKRKEYLRWTDDFFGFQLVAERLRRTHPFASATIYGELFGGHYPHPDVAPDPRVQAVQTGLHYSPTIEFCAFDITVASAGGDRRYLDYAQVVADCRECGVLVAEPLLVGKLNQALHFDTRFDSRVPATLGLPPIVPNLVEGIVVKPWRHIEVQGAKGGVRPVFKVKNAEFAEEQFHEAQPWSYRHEGASPTERLQFLLPELFRYLNDNRYHSARSKVGTDPRLVVAEMAADALASFWEANAELLDDVGDADREWLHERVTAEAGRRWPPQ